MMTAAIVVGVDGSAVGLRAVDLAVREARLRDRPIRVVCANTWASHPAWVDVVPTGPLAERLNIEPQRAVQEALDHVAAHSQVRATGEVLPGHPTTVLIEESRHAALVVPGHRGAGRHAAAGVRPGRRGGRRDPGTGRGAGRVADQVPRRGGTPAGGPVAAGRSSSCWAPTATSRRPGSWSAP